MLSLRPWYVLAVLALVLTAPQRRLLAQSCPPTAALLATNDPIYADAMELSRALEANGFTVQCVFPTKLGSMFEVADGGHMSSTIAGEANFQTNYGSVDVVFLPETQTFADFKITEHRENSGYLYTFAGNPRVWNVDRLGTARRMYFLKHGNHLLLVGDAKLRARLEKVLQVSWQVP
jgi:hypothetical protein